MNECRFEDRVKDAAATGCWTEDLRDHCSSCAACAETTLVTAALCADAEMVAEQLPALPDPRVIWIRARLEKRQQKTRKAFQGVVWVHRVTLFCAALFGLGFASELLPHAARVVDSINPLSLVPRMSVALAGPGLVLIMTFGVLGLMALWHEVAGEH